MPTNYRVQIVGQVQTADISRDYITNVLHYASNTTSAAAIGDGVKTAFTTNIPQYANFTTLTVKVYDVSLPLHSPPVYQTQHTGSGMSGVGARQVALCLSFYSGLNIKGQRGRIYIGPWQASDLQQFPLSGVLTLMINLAAALKSPGGADVVHQIWHPKTATWSNVSNYFVNNRWDTMRSRLMKETSRLTLP